MTDITLKRTGSAPVRFDGELLAEVAHEPPTGSKSMERARWHDLRVYQHSDGRVVLALGFRSRHELDSPNDVVLVFNSLDHMREEILENDAYCPAEYVTGYPTEFEKESRRAAFEERQRRLEERIEQDFDARFTELLERAGYAEEL